MKPRSRSSALATGTALLLALVGCGRSEPIVLGSQYQAVVDVPPEPIRDIDLLFVIDNSGSMQEEQAQLGARARQAFFEVLEQNLGAMPNLHIGVVSTNVGAGGYNISSCQGRGDDGRLLVNRANPDCLSVEGNFVVDVEAADGTRQRNYTGALEDTFACMVGLGTIGCGLEQPFEAMQRALEGTRPENAGFLRPDALLVVVLLTDEDDCSASDGRIFDPAVVAPDSELGPFSSFRCFEFGVTCEGGEPREPGARDGCEPNEDSAFIRPVSHYVSFLDQLKGDPTKVMVLAISGGRGPVGVGRDGNGLAPPGYPALQPVCPLCDGLPCDPPAAPPQDPTPDAGPGELPDAAIPADAGSPPPPAPAYAYPAFRVPALVDAFPARSSWSDLCAGDMEAALRRGAEQVVNVAGGRACLAKTPRDLDATTAGLQPSCRAFDIIAPQTVDERRTAIPACAAGDGGEPCFEVVAEPACGAGGTPLTARVHRGAAPEAAHFVVECIVD